MFSLDGFSIIIGVILGSLIAAELPLGVRGRAIVIVGGGVVSYLIHLYTPLPLVYGFGSPRDSSSGFWGFKRGDDDE